MQNYLSTGRENDRLLLKNDKRRKIDFRTETVDIQYLCDKLTPKTFSLQHDLLVSFQPLSYEPQCIMTLRKGK